MEGPGITILALAIILIISIILATNKNKKCQKQGERPFVWGYVQGYAAIITAILAIAINVLFLAMGIVDGEMWAYATYAFIIGFLGYLVIQRNRWAFVIKTFISGNIILWVINGIYIYNRWHEMAAITPKVEVISDEHDYQI